MDTKKLRQKILDLAIRGKLVPQDPNDEPASVLLEHIRAEKERLIKEGKIKRSKNLLLIRRHMRMRCHLRYRMDGNGRMSKHLRMTYNMVRLRNLQTKAMFLC